MLPKIDFENQLELRPGSTLRRNSKPAGYQSLVKTASGVLMASLFGRGRGVSRIKGNNAARVSIGRSLFRYGGGDFDGPLGAGFDGAVDGIAGEQEFLDAVFAMIDEAQGKGAFDGHGRVAGFDGDVFGGG